MMKTNSGSILIAGFVALIMLSTCAAPVRGATFDTVCEDLPWACSTHATTSNSLKQADRINRIVNDVVRPVTDLEQYGVDDHWALPTALGGDCEDIALLKKKMLIELEVAGQNLLLATTVHNTQNGVEAHAVLLYDDGQYMWVLDNLSDRMIRMEHSKYMFLLVQDRIDPRKWVVSGLRGAKYE